MVIPRGIKKERKTTGGHQMARFFGVIKQCKLQKKKEDFEGFPLKVEIRKTLVLVDNIVTPEQKHV